MVKKQEKELERLKSEAEEYQEKSRSAQNALDSSYKSVQSKNFMISILMLNQKLS